MIKELTESKLIKIISRIHKRIGLKDAYYLKRENCMRWAANVWRYKRTNICLLEYNMNLMNRVYKRSGIIGLTGLILHEFGHLTEKHFLWPETKFRIAMVEYYAEKRGLKWLRKYYPSYYKRYIREQKKGYFDNDWLFKFNAPQYYEAWTALPEYINF